MEATGLISFQRPQGVALHVAQQDPRSELLITPQFRIEFTSPMPNRWQRFWYRLLLGWEWRSR